MFLILKDLGLLKIMRFRGMVLSLKSFRIIDELDGHGKQQL